MAEVQHQPEQNRFVLDLGDDQQARLKYQMLDDRRVDFVSTYVPESHRGRGYARRLVDAGLAWARGNDYQIEASCSYVQSVLQRGG